MRTHTHTHTLTTTWCPPAADGVLFRGNLRGDPAAAYAKLAARLKVRPRSLPARPPACTPDPRCAHLHAGLWGRALGSADRAPHGSPSSFPWLISAPTPPATHLQEQLGDQYKLYLLENQEEQPVGAGRQADLLGAGLGLQGARPGAYKTALQRPALRRRPFAPPFLGSLAPGRSTRALLTDPPAGPHPTPPAQPLHTSHLPYPHIPRSWRWCCPSSRCCPSPLAPRQLFTPQPCLPPAPAPGPTPGPTPTPTHLFLF